MDIVFNFCETFGILTLLLPPATIFQKNDIYFAKRSFYLNGLFFILNFPEDVYRLKMCLYKIEVTAF